MKYDRLEKYIFEEGTLQEAFGENYDRFRFPGNIDRVTAGQGGEALLISGSEKKVLIDCGMAYCGEQMAANVAHLTNRLDYVLLSHSHYDHIGALPYIRERFPEVVVCGSAKCASIIIRESARELMVQLGEEARDLYMPGSETEIRVDGLNIDRVLADGDFIELGDGQTITAYETFGHTDCSLSYFLEPERVLFASESTGILEAPNMYIHRVLSVFPILWNPPKGAVNCHRLIYTCLISECFHRYYLTDTLTCLMMRWKGNWNSSVQ